MVNDRGSGSTFTAALVLVLVSIGTLGFGLVQAHLVAGRTQAAADLAALAGARSGGCDRAAAIARANGAELADCFTQDGDLVVVVQSTAPTLVSRVAAFVDHGTDRVWATARAG